MAHARTLWEEGQMSGRRVVRLAIFLGALITITHLLLTQSLGIAWGIGFALISIGAALLVRSSDFFAVGVLPPLLMLGLLLPVAVFRREWIAEAADSQLQALVNGLVAHATALIIGYSLSLATLAIRAHKLNKLRELDPYQHEASDSGHRS